MTSLRIPNKNVVKPSWSEHFLQPSHVGFVIKVEPVKPMSKMKIVFPMPEVKRFMEIEYIRKLFNDHSKGGLEYQLKNAGFIQSISTNYHVIFRGYSMFQIDINLTKKGIRKHALVFKAVLEYLKFIRNTKFQNWIFEALVKRNEWYQKQQLQVNL